MVTTGSNPVKRMWSSCENHVRLLWMWNILWNTLWNKKSFLHKIMRLILPCEKMCEIVTCFFELTKKPCETTCEISLDCKKHPAKSKSLLWNMKATLWKNCEILSLYYGPKKVYETTWEIRMGFLQLNELFWGWFSPVKKCVKSYIQ